MLEQLLKNAVQAYPEQTALVYGDQRLSYQELYHQVVGLNQGFQSLGVQSADRIAFILPNCPEFIIAFYAIALLGAVAVPLNPLFKEEELRYYTDESEASLIITDLKHLPSCYNIATQSTRKIGIVVIDSREPKTYYFYDLISSSPSNLSQENRYGNLSDVEVLYQYSSGTTGRPKRVKKTHYNLASEADNFYATVNITPDDAILCLVPIFHTYGFGNCVLAPIRAGAKLVMLEPIMQNGRVVEVPLSSRTQHILEIIHKEQISVLPAVPYIYQFLVDYTTTNKPTLSSLRICFSAGNFLSEQLFNKFLQMYGIPIRQQYGCTEAGAITVNLESQVDPMLAGKPLHNTEISVVNEQQQPLTDEIGEVIVRSPSVVKEYHKQPELNRLAFRDGYYFTGDLGKVDSEGRLYLIGRKKIFIDTGGYKVDPAEVEDVLHKHPQVAEVAVVGIKGGDEGEIIKAVIVPRGPCLKADIISYCKARLADFKVPRIVEFRAELPRSPLGKLLRKDLLESSMPIAASSIVDSMAAAHTSKQRCEVLEIHLEELLTNILNLSRDQIDRQRPLGEYGLNSISILELRNRLETSLSVPFSPTLIWNYPTVKALAGYLCKILENEDSLSLPS